MDELLAFGFTEEQVRSGEIRGDLKSRGMWQIPVSYKALLETKVFDDTKGYTTVPSADIFGVGTLSKPKQSGYQLEGRVSLNGKKYRGFTSSQLFELPDGHLVAIATIFVCLNQRK